MPDPSNKKIVKICEIQEEIIQLEIEKEAIENVAPHLGNFIMTAPNTPKVNIESTIKDDGKIIPEGWYDRIYPEGISWSNTENKRPLESEELPLRLFDIKNEKIIKNESKKALKGRVKDLFKENVNIESYATLSYVWGGNYNNETRELSLGGKESLKKAIKTLEVLRGKEYGLDIEYLWIDQWCINQSDTKKGREEKAEEIPKMGQYYGNSKVTLISIKSGIGELAIEDWLKSFKKDGFEHIDMNSIVSHSLPILQKIINSEWFEHSWTFQEGWLSKQTIFMFEDILIDGRFMALIWDINQNSGVKYNKKYNNLEEAFKNNSRQKVATPIGWVYNSKGYGIKDEVYLRLYEALQGVKERKRFYPIDGIYSILGLLPYGKNVKVDYKTEVTDALRRVMLRAIEDGYGEPFAWYGKENSADGLCWMPQIDKNGSTSIEGGIRVIRFKNIASARDIFLDKDKSIKVSGSEYVITWKDDKDGDHGSRLHHTNFRKVDVQIDTNEKITLIGTEKDIGASGKEKKLIFLDKNEWKSSEPFAILASKMENGIYHREGLVKLRNEDGKKLQGGINRTFIIGLDNQEIAQQYENQIEIPCGKPTSR